MATIENNKVVFQGGEILPEVGSEAYKQAQAGVLPTAPTTPTVGSQAAPISSATMTGESPLKLPTAPVSTTAAGINGASSAIVDSTKQAQTVQQQIDAQYLEAQKERNKSREEIQNLVNEYTGVQGSRVKMEEEAGIGRKTDAYNSALTNLEASQRAQVNEERAIRSNSNLTKEQADQQVAAIRNKYAFEQADLSLILSVANRDLTSAQSMIDRKIQLTLEPLKTALEFKTLFYQDNKDAFNAAEKRMFEQRIKQDEREYEKTKTLQEQIGKLQLQAASQGAPASVISSISRAKNFEEAVTAAGTYAGDVLDREYKKAQIAKLRADAAKVMKELGNAPEKGVMAQAQAKGNIDLLGELVKDSNLNSAVGPNPLARVSFSNAFTGGKSNFIAGIEQLRSQLSLDSLIQAKERGATFGALSEGELRLLTSSASKIGSWAIKDKNDNIVGYKTSESEFKKELDKIRNFAKLDYLLKGGKAEDVGAQAMPDGTVWVQNSDGSYTQLN